MPTKKSEPKAPSRPHIFSVRLSEADARKVAALAEAHDWPQSKTTQS